MTDQEQSDAWAALDALVGKLPLHQFAALRKAVETVELLRRSRGSPSLVSIDDLPEVEGKRCPRCQSIISGYAESSVGSGHND